MHPTRTVLLALAISPLLAACSGSSTEEATPGTTAPAAPLPPPSNPEFDYDYTVAALCIKQERVIGYEAKILQRNPPPEESIPLLIEARKVAMSTIPDLREGDRTDLIPPVRRWANSFTQSIELAREGADGLDTLRPAIKALLAVEQAQTCELDND